MSTAKTWTRDQINELLTTRSDAVERAMVRLYELQTADERSETATKHSNGIGFSSYAAGRGSYYARWVQSGRHLTGDHLERARKIALRHSGQLVAIANGR